MKFGLSDYYWKIVEDTVIKPLALQGCDVWIFGSRAKGNYKPFSDIDILYETKENLPIGFMGELKLALEDSSLPVKVDLVALQDLSLTYRDDIMSSRILLTHS